MTAWRVLVLAAAILPWTAARADTPREVLERYALEAAREQSAFSGFDAERGRSFYMQKHAVEGVGALSCSSCHRKDPRERILRHRVEVPCRACHVINDADHPAPKDAKKRVIEPFAPSANPERFTEYGRAEDYFFTNCRMLLRRECTAQEKGDLLTWLLSVEGGPVTPPSMRD